MKLWEIDYRRRSITDALEQEIRHQEAPSLKAAKELAQRTAEAEGWEWAKVCGRVKAKRALRAAIEAEEVGRG